MQSESIPSTSKFAAAYWAHLLSIFTPAGNGGLCHFHAEATPEWEVFVVQPVSDTSSFQRTRKLLKHVWKGHRYQIISIILRSSLTKVAFIFFFCHTTLDTMFLIDWFRNISLFCLAARWHTTYFSLIPSRLLLSGRKLGKQMSFCVKCYGENSECFLQGNFFQHGFDGSICNITLIGKLRNAVEKCGISKCAQHFK